MKILRSFLLFGVGLCATTLLLAQEVTTQVQKHTEVKPPPASAENNKPSPAPVFKPQPAVAATAPAAAASTAAPSPFKKDEAGKTKNKQELAPVKPLPVTDVQPVITQTVMQPAFLKQQQK